MRVAYFYSMRDDGARIGVVAPQHAAYWQDLRLPEYVGGPFADRSGGLITFEVESLDRAEALVAADPFVREDLLDSSVVKPWMPE